MNPDDYYRDRDVEFSAKVVIVCFICAVLLTIYALLTGG